MSLAWFLPLPGSYAGVDVVGVYNFACSLREVLAKHPFLPHGCGLFSGSYFPSFSEGLSLRQFTTSTSPVRDGRFPFLFGGTFIEAALPQDPALPSNEFPFLFGGTFIEALRTPTHPDLIAPFPFLFGGTFIEAVDGEAVRRCRIAGDFPSFSEGLSLRRAQEPLGSPPHDGFPFLFGGTFIEAEIYATHSTPEDISLPFRRDFH